MPEFEKLPWIDIETFGLDENADPILEVGLVITDLNLNEVASKSWVTWVAGVYDHRYKELVKIAEAGGDDYVLQMHRKNNLWTEARGAFFTPRQVEWEAIRFLEQNEATGLPMCGSSVHFDQRFIRAQMPELLSAFHRRIIDNSTLKELCRRYNRRVYENLPEKKELHRAIPDCRDTIEEFKFYRDEFLLW